MIDWGKATREDIDIINKIAKRAVSLFPILQEEFGSLQMDITAAHISQKMDLEKLLNFDVLNFSHDIWGIVSNIDRSEGSLKNCFLPRCSL